MNRLQLKKAVRMGVEWGILSTLAVFGCTFLAEYLSLGPAWTALLIILALRGGNVIYFYYRS